MANPLLSFSVEGMEINYNPLAKFGMLYNWYAATDARNICSDGWHIPSRDEWLVMVNYLGGYIIAGGKLKETGLVYWDSPNIGATNEVKFNARAGGYRLDGDGEFYEINLWAIFWANSIYNLNPNSPHQIQLYYNHANVICSDTTTGDPTGGNSIRAIKDSTTLSHGQTGIYTGNDGKVYRTICIGTQEWLADNLCETKYRNGDAIPVVTDNATWAALATGARCAYDNDFGYVWEEVQQPSGYGLLYNWYAATDARNIAAIGWTAPSNWTDWLTLINYLGGQGVAGGKIKEVGFTYWVSPNTGATNEAGFNARGSGTRFWDGEFGGIMYNSYFWSTEETSLDYASSPFLSCSEASFTYSQSLKYFGLPIRLIRPATEAEQLLADGTACDNYIGNDLKQYRTVKIGTQVWLSENLAETRFRYSTKVNHGALYNWWAATDAREITSAGWHIPTSTELNTLRTYAGGLEVAGTKLRESGTTYWNSGSGFIEGTNDYGFNCRGAGVRDFSAGYFYAISNQGMFWCSDANPYGYYFYTLYNINNLYLFDLSEESWKSVGFSIRPIKDSTTLTHGQTGTYTGNDGKVYRTICIGTQEWLADNLAETKYRNGDDIPIVTDDATWAALVTGAMCYYNNDISLSHIEDYNLTEITDNEEWIARTEEAYCAYDNNWSNVSFIYTGLPSEWTEPKYLSIGIV